MKRNIVTLMLCGFLIFGCAIPAANKPNVQSITTTNAIIVTLVETSNLRCELYRPYDSDSVYFRFLYVYCTDTLLDLQAVALCDISDSTCVMLTPVTIKQENGIMGCHAEYGEWVIAESALKEAFYKPQPLFVVRGKSLIFFVKLSHEAVLGTANLFGWKAGI